jgi:hypothetical protein
MLGSKDGSTASRIPKIKFRPRNYITELNLSITRKVTRTTQTNVQKK